MMGRRSRIEALHPTDVSHHGPETPAILDAPNRARPEASRSWPPPRNAEKFGGESSGFQPRNRVAITVDKTGEGFGLTRENPPAAIRQSNDCHTLFDGDGTIFQCRVILPQRWPDAELPTLKFPTRSIMCEPISRRVGGVAAPLRER
jgi:hypothetical protein